MATRALPYYSWHADMRKADLIISIGLLGFISFYAYMTAQLPARNLPHTLGGDFVPWVLIIFLLILSLSLLIKSLFGKGTKEQVAPTTLREYGGILLLFALILLYIQGMLYFGYIITTPIFMGIMMWITGSKKLMEIGFYSVMTTLVVYILFSRIFEVALPEGKIF